MVTTKQKLFRMKHRISYLMVLLFNIVDDILGRHGVHEPLYAQDDSLRVFSLLPGLWAAYCQGWADYYAYELWREIGTTVRGQLRPLQQVVRAGWWLPPSATFATRVTTGNVERALRRTGFMAQQAWMYLNLAVGHSQGPPVLNDGVLMDSPHLAFFYVRGWKDRRFTFEMDIDDERSWPRFGREFATAPGTFVGPTQYIMMPVNWEAPTSRDPRRMVAVHYVDRVPGSHMALELGSIDEANFELHIDLVQVMNEEYYSRALYRYLNDEKTCGGVQAVYNANPVHDAWRSPAIEDRGDAEGSEHGPDLSIQMPEEEARARADGTDVDELRREDPVGQEDPMIRGEPAGSEEVMDFEGFFYYGP